MSRKRGSLEKIVLSAVIGAAVGSVVGATISNNTGNKSDSEKKFDEKAKMSDDKPKSLLRRLRLYLKSYNERNQR
jgi:hypothetical protein